MVRTFPIEAARPAGHADLRRIVAVVDRLVEPEVSEPETSAGESTLPDPLVRPGLERKRVAVLVVEVDGFTELSSRADPEVMFKRQAQLLRSIRQVVDRFGGHVQRAVDDQIFIFFGVPLNRNNDLVRALDCSHELQRHIGRLADIGLDVQLAIGAHVGEVTVDLQDTGSIKYSPRGDTTRLPRRLSAMADHQQVLVSEQVLRAAGGLFRMRKGPTLPSRGGRPLQPFFLF
jgi:adenylate cyclase